MSKNSNDVPAGPGVPTGDAPTASTVPAPGRSPGSPLLGIIAVLYAAAACAFEVYIIVAIGGASAMELDRYTVQFFVILPLVVITGIILCTVAGVRAPRTRKLAEVGGYLLFAPLLGLIVTSVMAVATQ